MAPSLTLASALLALEATTADIDAKDAAALNARAYRDHLIITALDGGATYRQLQNITHLSRSAIIKIQNAPRRYTGGSDK